MFPLEFRVEINHKETRVINIYMLHTVIPTEFRFRFGEIRNVSFLSGNIFVTCLSLLLNGIALTVRSASYYTVRKILRGEGHTTAGWGIRGSVELYCAGPTPRSAMGCR